MTKERKRLEKLDRLKRLGGPFTDADELKVAGPES